VLDSSDARYTHRIVGVQEDNRLILRGDNNEVDDPSPVDPASVVGVVDGHLTDIWATLALQLQSWPLRICVLIMIIGLVFLPIAVGAPAPSGRRSAAASPPQPARDATHTRRGAAAERTRQLAAASTRGRRSAKAPAPREQECSEVLDLVDSLRSAIAGVLLSSDRRLGGHFTVTTQRGEGDFPSLRLIVDVTEKGQGTPARPQPVAEVPVAAAAPPQQWSNGHDPLLWTRPAGSVPMDLPSRRAQRAGTQRGRRRAR
jgi:hypothetical protein